MPIKFYRIDRWIKKVEIFSLYVEGKNGFDLMNFSNLATTLVYILEKEETVHKLSTVVLDIFRPLSPTRNTIMSSGLNLGMTPPCPLWHYLICKQPLRYLLFTSSHINIGGPTSFGQSLKLFSQYWHLQN